MHTTIMCLAIIVLGITCIVNANEIRALKASRPTRAQIVELLDPKSKIYEMLNARMDCEKIIPKTQECILYYEYLVVEKP